RHVAHRRHLDDLAPEHRAQRPEEARVLARDAEGLREVLDVDHGGGGPAALPVPGGRGGSLPARPPAGHRGEDAPTSSRPPHAAAATRTRASSAAVPFTITRAWVSGALNRGPRAGATAGGAGVGAAARSTNSSRSV